MQENRFTIEEVRSFWDAVAPSYDRLNSGFDWTHVERFLTMKKYLPKGKQGLRVGNVWSRTGNAVPHIREICPDADISNLEAAPKMMELARNKYPNERFALTDLHDLPWETGSLDVVVSLETLEHVPDPLHFLLECHRVLTVGGRLILSAPQSWTEPFLRLYETFFENHGEGPHRFPAAASVLRALRGCGFDIVDHRGTVLLPVGPVWLKRGVEWLQQHFLRYIGTNRLTFRHFYVAEKRSETDPVWLKIREEILRPGLSMHSGTRVGLSGGTLRLADPDGACLCEPTGTGPVPEICYQASPEVRPSYPEMNAFVFGSPKPRSPLLGHYKRIAIAHATDEAVRRNGASGGILTCVLLHLLETGRIKGAVVLTMDPEHPWRAKPIVARTKEEILASAQSKYVVSPVNTILGELEREEGPLAYVGLPHQVFAIRRLQRLKHPSVRAIRYVFGPFFGNELHGSAVDSFLRKFGAKKEDVRSLAFRAGEWPGHMEVRLKNGRVLTLPKFHANYLIPFHITRNSLLSHDLTNELTDLSGGDAWAPVYEERGKGFSLLLARTEEGDALIREMEERKLLTLKDSTEDKAIVMQSHGLDFKKRGSQLRIARLERRGHRVPLYGLDPIPVHASRRVFESILGFLFWISSRRTARWIADHAPDAIVAPLFLHARTLWKKGTRNVKRAGLRPLPFAKATRKD
jgi:coenzyme F420 hydrogenase subunit beta